VIQHLWHPPSLGGMVREIALSSGLPAQCEEVQSRVSIEYTKAQDRYESMGDAVTFCSRCAFMWDIKGMRLCSRCGKNYHSFEYNCCRKCHDEDRYGPDLFGG
jgi:hypothetical protein